MVQHTAGSSIDPLEMMSSLVTLSSASLGWNGVRTWGARVPAMDCVIPHLRYHTLIIPDSDMSITAHTESRSSEDTLRAGYANFMPAAHAKYWTIHTAQAVTVADFDPLFLDTIAAQAFDSPVEAGLLHPVFNVRDPHIASLIGLLVTEASVHGPGSSLFVDSIAHALAIHILRTLGPSRPTPVGGKACLSQRKLRRVVDFIDGSLADDISLARMADEAGISTYHFSRLFKQSTGSSPYRYLTGRRIEHAKRLLTTTRLPLVEIALEVGFASQSRFTEAFRRHVGTTPSSYRQTY